MLTNSSRAIAFGAIVLLAGCATTVPKAQFSKGAAPIFRVRSSDLVKVNVDASSNVQIPPSEEQRLAQEIEQKIDDGKMSNPPAGDQKDYDIEVHVTRYNKGSKFARFMLAGLGQIHIDGEVGVFQRPDHKLVETFELSKTFAWGGVYGASTSITDIENTFADGVAYTLTGREAAGSKAAM